MKKNAIVILSILFSLTFLASSCIYVQNEYPVKEISGVMKDVKTIAPESGWDIGYTVIEFKDGRRITFNGTYTGLVFQKDKECTIAYQYVDTSFTHGTFIKNIEYGK
jgi:hypothetical protein